MISVLLCTHVKSDDVGGVAASARKIAEDANAESVNLLWLTVPMHESSDSFELMLGGDTVSGSLDAVMSHVGDLDSVLAHYVRPNTAKVAKQIAETRDCKLVLNFRGNDATLGCFEESQLLGDAIFRADTVVAVASHLLLLLGSRFSLPDNTLVIENGVSAANRPATKGLDDIRFCASGMWKWKKGLHVLLDALLLEPSLASRTTLFGNIDLLSERAHIAYEACLGCGMKPIQELPHHQMRMTFNEFDAVVIPSLVDGMPNVMFEAIGAGCAVVGSRIPGIQEVLSGQQFASLVPPGNPILLSRKMDELTKSPAMVSRMKKEAYEAAKTWATPPNIFRAVKFS